MKKILFVTIIALIGALTCVSCSNTIGTSNNREVIIPIVHTPNVYHHKIDFIRDTIWYDSKKDLGTIFLP